jgi:alkanesulfonate monooxygenase
VSLVCHWFLPTHGDGRELVGGSRSASLGYLAQVCRAAEELGFVGALAPTGAWCEDAWVTTAMLSRECERLKFLVAVRPGLTSATLAAQTAATFARYAPGRLLLNVVTGGEDHEQRSYGDHLDKAERYRRTGEFLTVARRLWQGERVSFAGRHIRVEDAALDYLPRPMPPIYLGGSSAPALELTAEHVDVYLTWGEPPAAVADKLAAVRAAAALTGRQVRFGIRLHVISRDTTAAAWARAEELLAGLDPEVIRSVQAGLARSGSEGQRRMVALHRGRTDALEVAPNLWAGVGLVRGGAGTALVGSHGEVADRIAEYHALGIDEFVFSGQPHLEEAYGFAEGVLPLLARRGLWSHPVGVGEARSAAVPFAGSLT